MSQLLGVGFGNHGEGYVRVGLLHAEDRLREAINRIDKLNFSKVIDNTKNI